AESSYNKYSSGKTNVTSGSVRLSGDEINLPKVTGDTIVLQGENSRVKLKLLEPEKLPMLSTGTYKQDKFVLILNDEDFNRLGTSMPKSMSGILHRYYFEDWRATKDLYNKLTNLSAASRVSLENSSFTQSLGLAGKYNEYLMMKKLYSIFIFIFMFLSLLFYVAAVLMLLLRQFEALDRTRRKYLQLRKIGITRKEFGKAVLGETRILFITPVAFGVVLGYSLMLIAESMVGGADLVKEFMSKAVVLTVVYIVFQVIACELSGRRFLNRIIEE
ncbi:MAG: hypothetical protein Q8930_08680, partial [Bacillota bacterium]|nr:hypothetical protein [Bacillota bacterium]